MRKYTLYKMDISSVKGKNIYTNTLYNMNELLITVRIINPQFTHLDINSIIFVLFAQFMCPTLCKFLFAYPQRSNLPYLTHGAHGRVKRINSALFLASQAPFCFFCFIACFFSVLRQKEKLDQVQLTCFFPSSSCQNNKPIFYPLRH